MKYKGLGFLLVLAFVLVVFAIAAAQNDGDDSKQKDALTVQPADQTSQEPNEYSAQEDVPAIQPADQTMQELNEDSAQEDAPAPQPIDQTTQEPNVGPEQKGASTALQLRMLKTISIDCTNTPIEDVIKMLAEQANVDIIKSPTVTGNVTAKLTNVPLEEALNNILAVNGYGCVIDKNMIRIAPADEIAQKGEILESRVYRITYADVAQVETALKKFISKRGSISSSLGTSNIIVTDTSSSIRAIDDFIAEIDRITPQVMVEVRIYDITSTDGFDIGAEWTAGRNNPITSSSRTKSMGTTTADTTTETTATTWQENDAGTTSGTESYVYKKSKPFVGGAFSAEDAGTIRFGILDTMNVELTLNILRSEVGAKLLANPRILVLDNETAEFKIISEIPYTETSQTSSGGSMTSISFKEVGVELKVTPHVTRDGMVRMHIIPEFGVVSEKGKLVGSVQTVPTVDTRKVDTKALLKDGQTVVLGGLRRRTVSQTVKKVPWLGDMPVMGQLFSDVSEEVKTNELIIFITPTILAEPTLSLNEFEKFQKTNFADPRITTTEEEKAEAEGVEK